jgi:hypothetical protein
VSKAILGLRAMFSEIERGQSYMRMQRGKMDRAIIVHTPITVSECYTHVLVDTDAEVKGRYELNREIVYTAALISCITTARKSSFRKLKQQSGRLLYKPFLSRSLVLQPHLSRFKPKTGTLAQMAARPERSAPTGPLSASGDSGWLLSPRGRSAQAIHARMSQCEPPTASLPPSGGDRWLDGPSAASVAA